MVKPDLLKKKNMVLYKAYHMKPGETMTVVTSGDELYTSVKEAIVAFLSSIKDIQELEQEKGALLNILELSFPVQKLQENEHYEEIVQDGNCISMAIKDFVFRMNLKKYRLKDFKYTANPKDQGQTLVFSDLDYTEMK